MLGVLARYDRLLPDLADYETLLLVPAQGQCDGRSQYRAIRQHCKALRMPTIGTQFSRLADAATRKSRSHLGYLEALLAAEIEGRESRAIYPAAARVGTAASRTGEAAHSTCRTRPW
jgi:hypothetical protein